MIKRMTLKQFVFIIPLLCFIGVFSIYPILTSFLYTFFDYRTNDQQYNSFYISEKFNAPLFVEDCDYVNYFISADMTLVSEEDEQVFASIQEEVTAMKEQYEGETATRNFQSGEKDEVASFVEKISGEITAIYDKYPDVEFYNRENMETILQDLSGTIVQSNFVGGSNYARLVQDGRFWAALLHTVIFMVCSVTLEFVLGMPGSDQYVADCRRSDGFCNFSRRMENNTIYGPSSVSRPADNRQRFV